MVEGADGLDRCFISCAAFDGDGALTGGGEEFHGIEHQTVEGVGVDVDAAEVRIEQAQAQQAGGGEQHGIKGVFTEHFFHAGGDVATDLDDLDIRAKELELRGTAHAAGADAGALRQGFEGVWVCADENVLNGGTGQHGGDGEAGGEIAGHVLEAVHGGVDLAVCEGDFELLDEDAFVHLRHVAELGEAEVLAFVTAGLDDLALDLQMRMRGLQVCRDHFGLSECQLAAAGAEDDFCGGHGGVPSFSRTGAGRKECSLRFAPGLVPCCAPLFPGLQQRAGWPHEAPPAVSR